MTLFLACVRDAVEASLAIDAGFDGVIGAPAPASTWQGRLESGAAGDVLVLENGTRRLVFARCVDAAPTEDDGRAVAGEGVLLATAGRLIDALPLPRLALLIAEARAHGLQVALAGGLEPPDVPRLLPLRPDALLFGRCLRDGRVLDPERLQAIARLAPAQAGARARWPAGGARDRIFVRDLVLPVAIGVYANERGRRQRVRFSIEAELDPPVRGEGGMAAIVSYDLFADTARRLTEHRHIDFVETIAEEIAAELLAVPRVALVRVRVEKLDVGPGAVGVEIERRRPAEP